MEKIGKTEMGRKLDNDELLRDFGIGVTTADFQQSGKTAEETLLLINLVKSTAMHKGEALTNFAGIPSTPTAL